MEKRKVTFSTFTNLLKERRPFSTLGILFPLSAIIISAFLFTFFNSNKESYEQYDFEKIKKNGIEKNATIVNIETANLSVNGNDVKIITYEYDNNGKKITDRFKTLESDKIQNLEIGKEVKIKYFENQSIIYNIKPFAYPIEFLIIASSIFILIGIPFLLIALIPSLKNYNLYKNGIIKDAEIISIEVIANIITNNGVSTYRTGAKKIIVNYFFIGKNGEKIFGKSSTTDHSILNEKKSGDKVKIFVSENNENKSCLIPKFEALKNNWKVQ